MWSSSGKILLVLDGFAFAFFFLVFFSMSAVDWRLINGDLSVAHNL